VDEARRVCRDLAQRIIELRLSSHMTQERLAERAGIDERNLRRIEAKGDARVHTLVRIAQALGVSVTELFKPPSQTFQRGPGHAPRPGKGAR